MRPEKLTVAGLRSYREARTLDFTDRSLIAILGDTGSGKSSLLEAIYGALYGASTWDARGLGALIADGVKTLQIELEFTARGKRYTVSRSTSRDNYPPSKHVLKGGDGEHIEGERNVNSRVVQLVGLSDKEFLRVVILPQGRFSELLQGTAGERTPILRGILGLGVLDEIRDITDRQASALGDALEPITIARARLYGDPADIARTAKVELIQHETRCENLTTATAAIASVEASIRAVELALPALQTSLEEAEATDLGETVATLQDCDAAQAELGAAAILLERRLNEFQDGEAEAQTKLSELGTQGITSEAIALAKATFDQLSESLPAMRVEAAEHVNAQTKLLGRAELIAASQLELDDCHGEAEAATQRLQSLEAEASLADSDIRAAQNAIADLKGKSGALATEESRLGDSVTALAAAVGLRREVQATNDTAQLARSAIQQRHDALLAANRAAHVAQGHQGGEPCPVCLRTLPDGFQPAAILGEEEIVAELRDSEVVLSNATKDLKQSDRDADRARQDVLAAFRSISDASTAVLTAAQDAGFAKPSLEASANVPSGESSVADLVDAAASSMSEALRPMDADQARIDLEGQLLVASGCRSAVALREDLEDARVELALHPLTERVEAAHAAVAQSRQACDGLKARESRLRGSLGSERDRLKSDESDHAVAAERIGSAAERIARLVRSLPPFIHDLLPAELQPSNPSLTEAVRDVGALSEPTSKKILKALKKMTDDLARWGQKRDEAQAGITRVRQEIAEAKEAKNQRVDRPRSESRVRIERAGGQLRALSASGPALNLAWQGLIDSMGAEPLPVLARSVDLLFTEKADAELSEHGRQVARWLEQDCTTGSLIARSVLAGLEKARTSVTTTLEVAGFESVPAITAELAAATQLRAAADSLFARATDQQPVAAGLDAGLTTLRTQLAILRDIKEFMSPSMFPNFVVTQRQTALLRIASSLLATLTRDAYGFGDDFMIVDRRTGQPRHAKTLSGGEAFLASLALALALVEISNRSGGQLDAIFLDEGFGSLDSSFLGDALDVLRRQATDGRLVGIISHLHAVASELDDVLVVTKAISGSDFRWLGSDEREQFLLDESSAGLLA